MKPGMNYPLSKEISPNIKTFLWRLIRRALATGERAGNLTSKIDKNCVYCGLHENDSLIFSLQFFKSRLIFSHYFHLDLPFFLLEQDGVQAALEILITHSTSDEIIQKNSNGLMVHMESTK
jgi:hypothetical protein